ncbi:MAG: cytidine deaminase [Woeseiaceae bacterium]
MDEQDLIDAALAVRQKAYCKYSNYYVGSALLDEHGKMHVGCNVENASYPEGTCAESNAIAAMIAAGGTSIRTIVVVGGHDDIEDCTPCGGCRQKIAEFADDDTRIVLLRPGGHTREFSVDELLPRSFHL